MARVGDAVVGYAGRARVGGMPMCDWLSDFLMRRAGAPLAELGPALAGELEVALGRCRRSSVARLCISADSRKAATAARFQSSGTCATPRSCPTAAWPSWVGSKLETNSRWLGKNRRTSETRRETRLSGSSRAKGRPCRGRGSARAGISRSSKFSTGSDGSSPTHSSPASHENRFTVLRRPLRGGGRFCDFRSSRTPRTSRRSTRRDAAGRWRGRH